MADSVAALLAKLNLSKYNETFEEEAINDVSLLTSMGADMLCENLEELGLDTAAIELLSNELFPDEEVPTIFFESLPLCVATMHKPCHEFIATGLSRFPLTSLSGAPHGGE